MTHRDKFRDEVRDIVARWFAGKATVANAEDLFCELLELAHRPSHRPEDPGRTFALWAMSTDLYAGKVRESDYPEHALQIRAAVGSWEGADAAAGMLAHAAPATVKKARLAFERDAGPEPKRVADVARHILDGMKAPDGGE